MRIDNMWAFGAVLLFCCVAYAIARLFAPPMPCAQWAAGDFLGDDHDGDDYQQRYDTCVRERAPAADPGAQP